MLLTLAKYRSKFCNKTDKIKHSALLLTD